MYLYTKEYRLKKADEFSSVFIFRKVRVGKWFKIHYKPNNLDFNRLGLIVSKKNNKKSNKRNYMKRIIRELFRTNQHDWYGVDIVVRINIGFNKDNYYDVRDEFIKLTGVFKKNVG